MPASVRIVKGQRVQVLEKSIADIGPLLNKLGLYLRRVSLIAFLNQGFNGEKWPKRAVPNVPGVLRDLEQSANVKPERFQATPVLVDSGTLRSSVRYKVVGPKSVEVYSDAPYAGLHQSGGTTITPVTATARTNLAAFLKANPEHRPSLGWLFRTTAVTTTVPARPFFGISEDMKPRLQSIVRSYLKQEEGSQPEATG